MREPNLEPPDPKYVCRCEAPRIRKRLADGIFNTLVDSGVDTDRLDARFVDLAVGDILDECHWVTCARCRWRED